MPVPIVIAGGGGHAREICSYLAGHPDFELLGVLDDAKPPSPFEQTQILGPMDCLTALLSSNPNLRFLTAFGDNQVRLSVVRRIESLAPAAPAAILLDRAAHTGERVEIGEGTLLAPGVVITARVQVGRHCIVNVKVSVSHDCQIGDFVNLNPGVTVCGAVRIGEGANIGAGATIIDKVSIGAWSIIGAGAVVIRDIPPRMTAVGVPARVIRTRETSMSNME